MRIEKRLLVALTVNVDQKLTHLPQEGMRSELIVDKDLVAAIRRQLTSNDEFFRRSSVYPGVSKQPFEIRIWTNNEQAFNRPTLSARLDQVARKPPANQNAESIDDDRLSRSSLARKQIKPSFELNLKLVNQRDVGDIEELKHSGAQITQN
jgi:hypothetical protein